MLIPEASGDPIKEHRYPETAPVEHEQRRDCTDVKKRPIAIVVVQFKPLRRGRPKTSAPAWDPDVSMQLQTIRDRDCDL